MDAWNRLCDIFQDNKNSRAVTLEAEFSNTKMENFPNVSTYCQRLKSLADRLKNVGAPVSENRLVIQLVSGLTRAYRGVGTLIRQSDPLPPFYQARSMLTLEEAGFAKEAATGSKIAMIASSPSEDICVPKPSPDQSHHRGKPSGNTRKNGRKNGSGGRGSGGGHGGSGGGHGGPQHQQHGFGPWGSPQ
ncbi:uncharacterized protein LOC104903482 [Beta vulgaris subsp. vulgaris]|uniref:uncharacterized protein LOC104903482 n=1 Tax=Beta vulgaris subsp. vulgaris TaxID=3555 RepID=UPI00203688FE|nr:uncharacterized protein LOC104903482 [Beta vulgaris subsp. vulgaris]